MAEVRHRDLAPGPLLELCESALKAFNPLNSTLDSHLAAVLSGQRTLSASDATFVRQALYGCVRYKAALKALITSFYYVNSATTSRGDYTKYLILSYLALFRLEELGLENFRKLVDSQAPEKMHVFLSFVFSKELLEKWVKDEWIKHFDLNFVEGTIIRDVERHAGAISDLCAEMSSRAFGLSQLREEASKQAGIPEVFAKPPTVPQPFNITPARPVRVPEPIAIVQQVKASPMPETLNQTSLSDLEEQRKVARERARADTMTKYNSNQHFKLHDTRDTLTKAVEDHEKRMAKLTEQRFTAKPVPDFDAKPAPVKLNAAAILREDAVYKKKQAQEASLLKAYEADLRDSTEFFEWQAARRKEDEAEKLRLVEQRRMESAASQQEARLATQRREEENQKLAAEMRDEGARGIETRKLTHIAEVEERRKRVCEVQETRDAPAIVRAKIERKNKVANREMRAEQKRREEAKRLEDELEQKRRNDLIAQIRALERVPTKRVTQFDPTESGGHGLLEEMSLLELKERLAMNEMREKKNQMELRQKIIQNRIGKEKAMKARLEVIRRARTAAYAANRKARQVQRERDAEIARLEQEVKDEAKIKLAEKLAAIREQREGEIQRLQDEEDRVQKRNMFLGAAKDMVEQRTQQDFVKGLERRARETQKREQLEAKRREDIQQREMAVRDDFARHMAQSKRHQDAQARAELQASKKKSAAKAYQHMKEKRRLVTEEQARQEQALSKLRAINPYATETMRRCLEEARAQQRPADEH